MKPVKRKTQDDRLLKQLPRAERKQQEALRRLIMNDTMQSLI